MLPVGNRNKGKRQYLVLLINQDTLALILILGVILRTNFLSNGANKMQEGLSFGIS